MLRGELPINMAQENEDRGQGWYGESTRHAQAGKLGGQAVVEKLGPKHMSAIGKIGGKRSGGNFKNDPERARIAGRKGGRARKRI